MKTGMQPPRMMSVKRRLDTLSPGGSRQNLLLLICALISICGRRLMQLQNAGQPLSADMIGKSIWALLDGAIEQSDSTPSGCAA